MPVHTDDTAYSALLLRRAPLLAVAILLTLGMVLALPVTLGIALLCIGGIGGAAAYLLGRHYGHLSFYKAVYLAGIAIAFVGVGNTAMQVRQMVPPNDIRGLDASLVKIQAQITAEPTFSRYGCQSYARAQLLKTQSTDSTWREVVGTIKVYADSTAMQAMALGSTVHFTGTLQPVRELKNAGYAQFLTRQEVYQVMRVKNIARVDDQKDFGAWLRTQVFALRNYLLHAMHTALPDPVTAGVAQALLLGARSQLDPDIKQAYRAAGATHILAVSGMHLTLLLAAIGYVLRGIWGRRTRAPWLVAACVLVLYCLMVGPMGSVLRAVGMSLFALAALLLRRKAPALNLLAATWILLLALDPNLLYDVGLQLSAAAVLGLLLAQPLIMRLFQHRARYYFIPIAELLSATLAAQLFTLPLIWFYFGQFPTYFLAVNLLAVPVGSAATLIGFVFMALCWLPLLRDGLGWLLGALIEGMNGFVVATERLPFAILTLPTAPVWLVVLVAVGIVGVTLAVQARLHSSAEPGWAFY